MREQEFRFTFWKYLEVHSTELPHKCLFNHGKICDLQCPFMKLKWTFEEKKGFDVKFLCSKFDPLLYIDSVEISLYGGKTS